MRTFSSGGGVQSIAALVLSARGVIDYPVHLFCNAGDDSENPDTLNYVRNVAMPYARAHGIEFVELQRTFKRGAMRGQKETLYGRMYRTFKSVPIPIYRSGGYPLSRTCTIDFKVRVIVDWLKSNGASAENPAQTGVGFSLDEWSRVKPSLDDVQILGFPLIDLRLTRADCQNVIEDAGLPLPPKSACWFCPVTSHAEWVRMANEKPEQFERACQLEAHLSQKYGEPLFLHKQRLNLREAVKQFYFDLDEVQECVGYCLT